MPVADCVAGCPAGIDIPGFLRRMEAKNYAGASPPDSRKESIWRGLWATLCSRSTVQKDCYRRDFAGKPVR